MEGEKNPATFRGYVPKTRFQNSEGNYTTKSTGVQDYKQQQKETVPSGGVHENG